MNLYGVKLLYRYTVAGDIFYEESVLRVRAENDGEAIVRAQAYANDYLDGEHINPFGQRVEESVCEIVESFEMQESGGDIEEVFSSIRKNRTALSDSGYVALMYDNCTPEELMAVRYREFNGGAER